MNQVHLLWRINRTNPNHYYSYLEGVYGNAEAAEKDRIDLVADSAKIEPQEKVEFMVEKWYVLDKPIGI